MIGGSKYRYIDTGALIALSDKNDRNHKRAVPYFKTAVKRGVIFILGKHVLIEYIDGVAKRIDLTDCLSFSIMERMNIDMVFTFDSDFQTHGFKVMP